MQIVIEKTTRTKSIRKCTNFNDLKEEIEFDSNTISVFGGEYLLRSITIPSNEKIKDACFARFMDYYYENLEHFTHCNLDLNQQPPKTDFTFSDSLSNSNIAMVVLTEELLRMYFRNGQDYIISVPFQANSIIPLNNGILVENATGALYSLHHPSREFKPVRVYQNLQEIQEFENASLLGFDNQHIITYNNQCNQLHIYEIMFNDCSETESSLFTESNSNISLLLKASCTFEHRPTFVAILKSELELDILWVLVKEKDELLGLSIESLDRIYCYKATSACLFQSDAGDTGVKRLLILMADNALYFWIGFEWLIPVRVKIHKSLQHGSTSKRSLGQSEQTPRSKRKTREAASRSRRIIELSTIGISVLVTFSDDSLGMALLVSKTPGQLVTDCLSLFYYILPDQAFFVFYTRLLAVLSGDLEGLNNPTEWDCFTIAFYSCLLGRVLLSRNPSLSNSHLSETRHPSTRSKLPGSVLKNLKPYVNTNNATEKLLRLHRFSHALHLRFHTDVNLVGYLDGLLVALHYLYQEYTLDLASKPLVSTLGDFLSQLFFSCKNDIASFYVVNGHQPGHALENFNFRIENRVLPNIIQWVSTCISSAAIKSDFTAILRDIGKKDLNKITNLKRLFAILEIYQELYENGSVSVVEKIASQGNLKWLDAVPIAIALPIRQALYECKSDSNCRFQSCEAYKLIGRNDLAAMIDPNPYLLYSLDDERLDIARLRFSKDDRMKQVIEILRPTQDACLEVTINPTMSVDEVQAAQQAALLIWANQSFSHSLGLAFVQFGESEIVPTEVFPIPNLLKSARLPPLNSMIELVVAPDSGLLDWPEFHVGVSAALQIKKESKEINSSWIVFNQSKGTTDSINATHAGFIFGLGLLGHLKKLDSADSLRNYFLPQFEILSVGHLLGLAVAYAGTQNGQITNMVSVHIPAMLPVHSVELTTASILKTGAIVGYGLLHFQRPSQYKYDKILQELESYFLSDNHIENMGYDSYVMGCGFALGFIGVGAGNGICLTTARLVDRLLEDFNSPIVSFNFSMAVSVSLGLLCLKTNNRTVANHFQIPLIEFLLDFVTPELLLIQLISRYLILWDDIEPTTEWVLGQIPQYMKDAIQDIGSSFTPKNEHIYQCYAAAVAALSFVISFRFASTSNPTALATIMTFLNELNGTSRLYKSQAFSKYVHSQKLYAVVSHMSINAILSSLAILMAGSGDLTVFNTLKQYHDRTGPESSYGSHMAVSMAIGLLFLSNGTRTIGTSYKAVATLYCSFFPLYPTKTSDNRCHLQALRHLWVLAVENRCLVTRDVETGKAVSVPVDIILNKDSKAFGFSPLLIPEIGSIKEIRITGPRYWEINIPIRILKNPSPNITIWVQRKTRYLPYAEVCRGELMIGSRKYKGNSIIVDTPTNREWKQ